MTGESDTPPRDERPGRRSRRPEPRIIDLKADPQPDTPAPAADDPRAVAEEPAASRDTAATESTPADTTPADSFVGFTVTVDPANQIAEFNEANNASSLIVDTVAP